MRNEGETKGRGAVERDELRDAVVSAADVNLRH